MGHDLAPGRGAVASAEWMEYGMLSLKSGFIGLALVGAALAVPQSAWAIASFSVDSFLQIGVRADYTGYNGASGPAADGTYTGGGNVTTTFKTSIDNGINSGSAQTTAGNYNGYTKKYVDIGKTGLNFDVTDLAVAPAYSGVPQPFTTLGRVETRVSGYADGRSGYSELAGGAYNTNLNVTFQNTTGVAQTIDLAFVFGVEQTLAFDAGTGNEGGYAGGTIVTQKRTKSGSDTYSKWSNLFTESYYKDPEFGVDDSVYEALRFFTLTLAPNTTTQINVLLAAEGGVYSDVPVPAALPLLGLGLGGLGLVGWRRRQSA